MSNSLKPNILVVEDEASILAVLKYNLRKQGYNVTDMEDPVDAIDFAKRYKPELIILDWMLPNLSGLEVCKILHNDESTQHIPIIMLTAKQEEEDKISALDNGADDYMTKPFSPNELNARIKSILRRLRPVFAEKIVRFDDIEINLATHIATRNEQELKLSPIEFNILLILMENPGRVFSREALMNKIWGNDVFIGARTIDVHITRLRKVLLQSSNDGVDIIRTVRLEGYSLRLPKKKAAAE